MIGVPLIVGARPSMPIPAYPLFRGGREGRRLYVLERTVYLWTGREWLRIPRGYVTDFASIPGLASLITLLSLQPLGPWAWAALGHDWRYAVGEPGRREEADKGFRARMEVDGVDAFRRQIMYSAVRIGGGGGYKDAPTWWSTENFADPETGAYYDPKTKQNPVPPPFPREEAFVGQFWGPRAAPDWLEQRAA